MASSEDLNILAQDLLVKNRRGDHTVPSPTLYPHQWLWDSCFIAMGLATFDPPAAAQELLSLLRGQWKNGMLPHIIFGGNQGYWEGPKFWQSERSGLAPAGVQTSAITQPPVVAIAAQAVALKLPPAERTSFVNSMYPSLVAYHQWLYRERDPQNSGLALIVHSTETGIDNSPPWMELLRHASGPKWLELLERFKLDWTLTHMRGDVKVVPLSERHTNVEHFKFGWSILNYREKRYNWADVIRASDVIVESLDFNCILAQANKSLRWLAQEAGQAVPPELTRSMDQTEKALASLWDETDQEFYSRNYHTKELMRVSSVATFMPLYAQTATKEQAKLLVKKLKDRGTYGTLFPVPSAPLDSPFFSDRRYWQGPVWINMNWFIIKGLQHYGYIKEAQRLAKVCLDLAHKSGFREYYSPLDGTGFGAQDFSWSAALTLELLQTKP